MKTLTVPIPDFNHTLPRVVVLGLAIAGLGLATWYGTQPPPADDSGSFVEQQATPPPNGYDTQTQPVVYRDRATADGQCSQWDVSPQAMEAILQEMLRRGWKPPTQGEAISSIAGAKIVSLDPNAPMPVFTRPGAPAEAEQPEEGVVSGDPDPTVTPPAAATPTTRPPATSPTRPPAAQPPTAPLPRTAPPAAATPRPPVAQPPAPPKLTTPPAAAPPAVPPAESAPPADPA
jgi:hypothetical protein